MHASSMALPSGQVSPTSRSGTEVHWHRPNFYTLPMRSGQNSIRIFGLSGVFLLCLLSIQASAEFSSVTCAPRRGWEVTQSPSRNGILGTSYASPRFLFLDRTKSTSYLLALMATYTNRGNERRERHEAKAQHQQGSLPEVCCVSCYGI